MVLNIYTHIHIHVPRYMTHVSLCLSVDYYNLMDKRDKTIQVYTCRLLCGQVQRFALLSYTQYL